MITIDGINTLMERIGHGEETIDAVARTGESEWAVAFDDGGIVSVELVEAAGKLLLSSLLGNPPAKERDAICRTLMSYNMLWARTGIVMAMGGDRGQVMQSSMIDVLRLDGPRLSAILVNFARKASVWREYLENGSAAAPEAALLVETGSSEAWIRA